MTMEIRARRTGGMLQICRAIVADLKDGEMVVLACKNEHDMETFQMHMLKLTDELIAYDLLPGSSDCYKIILI